MTADGAVLRLAAGPGLTGRLAAAGAALVLAARLAGHLIAGRRQRRGDGAEPGWSLPLSCTGRRCRAGCARKAWRLRTGTCPRWPRAAVIGGRGCMLARAPGRAPVPGCAGPPECGSPAARCWSSWASTSPPIPRLRPSRSPMRRATCAAGPAVPSPSCTAPAVPAGGGGPPRAWQAPLSAGPASWPAACFQAGSLLVVWAVEGACDLSAACAEGRAAALHGLDFMAAALTAARARTPPLRRAAGSVLRWAAGPSHPPVWLRRALIRARRPARTP
jgi:hypothetical protein